jgi:hypothetical protein
VTTLAERVDVDAITAQARDVDFGRLFLAGVAAVLVFIGRAAGVAVMALAWACVAVRVGYREVRPRRDQAGARR